MGDALIQIMGGMDFLVAMIMILIHFDVLGWRLGFVMALYLFIKAWSFREDLASLFDGITGIWMLLVMVGLHSGITYVFVLYMMQKAMVSFL